MCRVWLVFGESYDSVALAALVSVVFERQSGICSLATGVRRSLRWSLVHVLLVQCIALAQSSALFRDSSLRVTPYAKQRLEEGGRSPWPWSWCLDEETH